MAKEPNPRKAQMTKINWNSSTGAKSTPKAGRLVRNQSAKSESQMQRKEVRAGEYGGQTKFTTTKRIKTSGTNSPVKPSVKGVANKVKAQGSKMNTTPSTTAAARAKARRKG